MAAPAKNWHSELKKVVRGWCNENIETLSVGVVTDVTSYSKARCVNVQPLIMTKQEDGKVLVPDVIYNCPVILQGTKEGFISFPIKVGDKVLVGHCKRSLEDYLQSTGTAQINPDGYSLFGSNNAVVLGYIGQDSVDLQLSSEDFNVKFQDCLLTFSKNNDIIVENSTAKIEALSDGTITVNNEQVSLVFNTDGTLVGTAPSGATINDCEITSSGNVITATGTDLDQTRADLDTFRDAYITHGTGASNHPPPTPY